MAISGSREVERSLHQNWGRTQSPWNSEDGDVLVRLSFPELLAIGFQVEGSLDWVQAGSVVALDERFRPLDHLDLGDLELWRE